MFLDIASPSRPYRNSPSVTYQIYISARARFRPPCPPGRCSRAAIPCRVARIRLCRITGAADPEVLEMSRARTLERAPARVCCE